MSQGPGPVPIGPLGARGPVGSPGAAHALPAGRRGSGEPGPRVVVVGAGLLGAATAEALTRRDAQVTVVDRGPAGAATSAQSMGWVNASSPFKTEHPRYLELSIAAVAAHDRVARDLAPAGWLHRRGHLEWVAEDGAEDLAARVELLGEYGYPAGVITAAEAAALEPAVRAGAGSAVAWYPAEVWVEGRRLVRRLLDAAASRGAKLLEETAVTALTRDDDGRVTGVELADGDRIAADAVVNAAGTGAVPLARAAGSPLTLQPAPALVAYVDTGAGGVPVSRPVTTPRVALRPHGTAHLWANAKAIDAELLKRTKPLEHAAAAVRASGPAPATPGDQATTAAADQGNQNPAAGANQGNQGPAAAADRGGPATDRPDLAAADHADLAAKLLGALAEAVELPAWLDLSPEGLSSAEGRGLAAGGEATTALAQRPVPSDGLPSVGRLEAAPGYYELVTHSGATLAPLLGDLLAEEIVTGNEATILAPFRPSRFAG